MEIVVMTTARELFEALRLGAINLTHRVIHAPTTRLRSFLVGVTEQGVQQFNCRRVRHLSTPGKVFMLEPGEIHDGHAPTEEGFTYSMLYLDPHWLERELHAMIWPKPVVLIAFA
jgi:hypothetical protein